MPLPSREKQGILNLTLAAHGKAGHAAHPWEADNALDRLIDGYVKVRNAWPAMSEAHYTDSLAATICQAGSVINRIPERAEMKLNIRYVNPEDKEKIIEKIRSLSGLEVLCGDDCCPPVACDPEAPALKELRSAMEKAFHREIGLTKEEPIKHEAGAVPGSISFVPSVAGLIIAGEVIKDLLREEKDNGRVSLE